VQTYVVVGSSPPTVIYDKYFRLRVLEAILACASANHTRYCRRSKPCSAANHRALCVRKRESALIRPGGRPPGLQSVQDSDLANKSIALQQVKTPPHQHNNHVGDSDMDVSNQDLSSQTTQTILSPLDAFDLKSKLIAESEAKMRKTSKTPKSSPNPSG